jgi:hypothetical protein
MPRECRGRAAVRVKIDRCDYCHRPSADLAVVYVRDLADGGSALDPANRAHVCAVCLLGRRGYTYDGLMRNSQAW